MISEMTLWQFWIMFLVPFSLGAWTAGNLALWIWTFKSSLDSIVPQMISTVLNLGIIFGYINHIAGTL
jgi:hypothetical protein